MSSLPQSTHSGEQLAPHLDVEFIASAEALRNLEAEWNELFSSLSDSTPFQSPHWLLPWWEHYGEGQLCSFAFRSGGELVGLAPLYIYNRRQNGSPGTRILFLLGTGNSDYLDFLVRPEFRDGCSQQLTGCLLGLTDHWDRCEFLQLRGRSDLIARMEAPTLRSSTLRDSNCPVVAQPLPEAARSMLTRAARYRRKLQGIHPFTIETATPSSFDNAFSELERLHGDRWRTQGLSGVLSKPRDRRFHRDAARRFLHAGMLRLYQLKADIGTIGVLYAVAHRSRTYFYISGFDPEFARFSIGTILIGHTLEQAFQQGSDCLDFLRGDESYKYRWGAHDEWTFRRVLEKPVAPGL